MTLNATLYQSWLILGQLSQIMKEYKNKRAWQLKDIKIKTKQRMTKGKDYIMTNQLKLGVRRAVHLNALTEQYKLKEDKTISVDCVLAFS